MQEGAPNARFRPYVFTPTLPAIKSRRNERQPTRETRLG